MNALSQLPTMHTTEIIDCIRNHYGESIAYLRGKKVIFLMKLISMLDPNLYFNRDYIYIYGHPPLSVYIKTWGSVE